MSEQHDNTILHEADVREVIQDEIEDTVGATGEAIDDVDDTTSVGASTSHALNSTFSDTEAETALNTLGTKLNALGATVDTYGEAINAILAVLRTNGLIEESEA